MKKLFFVVIAGFAFSSFAAYQPEEWNLEARKAFAAQRFGVFIHWGLYANYAQGEWYLQMGKLDEKAYSRMMYGFCPSKFDAKEWVRVIKGAEVEDCPYLDSAGVLQAAIQELFLQSHAEEPSAELFSGGPIRLLPGVPRSWSGSFKLLARGGFEVECAFEKGVVTTCTVLSTRGGICSYVDPVSGLTNRTTTLSGEVVVIRGP